MCYQHPPGALVGDGRWHRRGTDLKRPLRQEEKSRKSACLRVTDFLRIIAQVGDKSLSKGSQGPIWVDWEWLSVLMRTLRLGC